jgi:hypothetical protein
VRRTPWPLVLLVAAAALMWLSAGLALAAHVLDVHCDADLTACARGRRLESAR